VNRDKLRETFRVAETIFDDPNQSPPLHKRSAYFSLNPLRRYVVRRRLTLVAHEVEAVNGREMALDFGPGGGIMLPVLSERFSKVVAVDIDPGQVRSAELLVEHMGCRNVQISLVQKQAELAACADSRFDLVLATDVLEHIERLPEAICEFRRILKPTGTLITSIPTEGFIYRLFENPHAGHVYHDASGAERIEWESTKQFRLIRRRNLLGLFWISVFRPNTGYSHHDAASKTATGWYYTASSSARPPEDLRTGVRELQGKDNVLERPKELADEEEVS
jgi:2-polyprenyl-3-methyl-5-hydroxy-6-metoxy-1,4-benzoquinol methylase